MSKAQLRSSFKLPVRSARVPGVHGIRARTINTDPAFDIDGLPDPFAIYFPIFITNLYDQMIYVTALLVSPPAGWNDSEQNVGTVLSGQVKRWEKNNATRDVMSVPHNETITVRWNYRTGGYAGTIIGFDDFQMTIYWESISAGTIEETNDFEVDYENWDWYLSSGTNPTRVRTTARVVHGAYSVLTYGSAEWHGYWHKGHTFASGDRAYMFGFLQSKGEGHCRYEIESKVNGGVETCYIVFMADDEWRRFGVRCTPGVLNTVLIWIHKIWVIATTSYTWFDYLRWVRY